MTGQTHPEHDLVPPPGDGPPLAAVTELGVPRQGRHVHDDLSPQASREEALAVVDRLREIAHIDLQNPELRALLDAICARTGERLDLPASTVTLVLDTSRLGAGAFGVDGWIRLTGGSPVEWSFCPRAAVRPEPWQAPDVSDGIGQPTPLLTVDSARTYLGVPLFTEGGQVLGVHCVEGLDPRDVTAEDVAVLQEAADEILGLITFGRPG